MHDSLFENIIENRECFSEPGEDFSNKFEQYENANRGKLRDKADKAITEKVMSPHVREILLRLINSGFLNHICGCVSSGKEANVYYATGGCGEEYAIKIYKTEILDYKNRSRYIEGEHRYKSYHVSKNPRKMVRKWAEKEFRNLTKLYTDGIPCPKPLKLTHNLLIMQFLGSDTTPLPLLKDCKLNPSQLLEMFKQIVIIMRQMFIISNLVHADLSEYNLLYDVNINEHGQLYVIDVSQSVQTDSPNALLFLRQDIYNVKMYFQKNGLELPSIVDVFSFITDKNIVESDYDTALTSMFNRISKDTEVETVAKNEVHQNVFKTVHIPHSLNELNYCDGGEDFYYNMVTSVKKSSTVEENDKASIESSGVGDKDSDATEDSDIEAITQDLPSLFITETNDDSFSDKATLTKEEIKAKRKANKKQVKEINKEKRKTKIPKHIKKAMEKKLLRK